MSMKTLYDLRDMVCAEMENSAKKGKIGSAGDLEVIDKLTHALKSIDTIIAMDEARGEGYSEASGRGRSSDRGDMRRYSSNGRYSMDWRPMGYGAGWNYGGRNYDGGYSNADGDMSERLRRMMDQATSDSEREIIRKLMAEM